MNNKNLLKNDFSKNILDKIKQEKVKTIPKYVFILKYILIWCFLFISIFIWALSLSISLEYLINADWSLLNKIWIIKIFTIFMPFFWLFFLILASIFSYYNFIHTEKWYKFTFIKILLVNIFLSLLLWIILYFSWIHNYIEWKIENNSQKYRTIFVNDKVTRMIRVWQNEEKWLLIWIIKEVDTNKIIFKDSNDKEWNIILNENTITDIKHKVNIIVWEKIKIIWVKLDNINFKAKEIRPFMWWKK